MITSIALSKRTDGYKLTIPYDTWISVGEIFHVFALLANLTVFKFVFTFASHGLDYFNKVLRNLIGWCSNC